MNLVIQNLCGLSNEPDGVNIGAVSEIETGNPIVTCRQSNPGGGVFRSLFGGVAEVTLGDAEIAAIEVLDAQAQGLVGAVIFDVQGLLHRGRRGWAFGDNRRSNGGLTKSDWASCCVAAHKCEQQAAACKEREKASHCVSPIPSTP